MSATEAELLDRLLEGDEEPPKGLCARCFASRQSFVSGCIGVFLFLYILVLIGNVSAYYVLTFGCGPKAIGKDYAFPGGGHSEVGGPSYNLLPQWSLVSEREHNFWGSPFDVYSANEAGIVGGAQVGTWWRNRAGPLFNVFSYQDMANSKLTIYMRSNFWLPWLSYKMARCDRTGPIVTFSEKGHWMSNTFNRFWNTNQAMQFSIWLDDKVVAVVQERGQAAMPSLTITNTSTAKDVGDSVLIRDSHSNKDQWHINNKDFNTLPYWVTSAISLPFAYDQVDLKEAASEANEKEERKREQEPSLPKATFLTQEQKTLVAKISTDLKEEKPLVAKEEQSMATIVTSEVAAEPQQHV